jgi:RNA-directed DNA polymerase
MISAYVSKRLETIGEVSKKGSRVKDLFSLLLKKEIWDRAYGRIAPNLGATTKGPDDVTLDGHSDDRIENMIELIREGHYSAKPARRTYIPKSNGKKRPLGIPAGDEKLIQEAVRHLLECVYEPVFSEHSHGFRPKKSCHTALSKIKHWHGTVWYIEFDVKGFYDNINHRLLIEILEKKIDDKRFIDIIKKMLRAGVLEDWKYKRTYSGTPQGGVVSPILANIYLHELDMYIEEMMIRYNWKKARDRNPEYQRVLKRGDCARLKLTELKQSGRWDDPERKELEAKVKLYRKASQQMPSLDIHDPDFRRLWYTRYADDFALGFIGPKSEALVIKEQIENYLQTVLRLEVSPDKTKVCKASDGIEFLGYDIKCVRGTRIRRLNGVFNSATRRTTTGVTVLSVPSTKVNTFIKKKGYGKPSHNGIKPISRPYLLNHSEVEIISLYNAEVRGLANYYSLAKDVKTKLSHLTYLATYSCLATLGNKHKSGITGMAKQMRTNGEFIWRYTDSKGRPKSLAIWQLKHLAVGVNKDKVVDVTPNPWIYGSRTELSQRLAANRCEYCLKEDGYFEVHHVRKLKDLKEKPHIEPWERRMIQRQRKTLVLCIECHDRLHAGNLPDMRLKYDTRSK